MKSIKWIIGYVDSHGAVHYHIVHHGDTIDSHVQVWPSKVSAHGKWRWDPKYPGKINTYGEDISDDDFFAIYYKIEDIINHDNGLH